MPPLPRPSSGPEVLSVYATENEEEIGIRTLVGEYVEKGTSYGRKCYQKTQLRPEEMDVFIFYWEDPDSVEFTGWWFGDEVGGTQAWSRNPATSQRPPKTGWTIPWDGEVRNELCVSSKMEKQSEEKKQALARMQARRQEEDARLNSSLETQWEQRVEQATEKCAEVELDARQALEMAAAVPDDDVDACKEALAALSAQQRALAEVQRFVAAEGVAAAKAPPILKKDLLERACHDDSRVCTSSTPAAC
ncbi:Man1a1 [Symbiodinium natans]|uniref:Man1a1 protein n=1 Tax=Symbiodinium natans TaxID=878477 RepID=A0A812T0A7_9DINO|nr:Man1a1 [Symbiodinium natans]